MPLFFGLEDEGVGLDTCMKDTIILNFLKDIIWRIEIFLHSMLVLAIHFVS